jgi:hypothetical protein
MSAFLLVALLATIALASAITLADGVVRGWNAVRLLRGDLARMAAFRQVTVSYEYEPAVPALPPLRSLAISGRRRVAQPVRIGPPLRVAA